MARGGGKRAGRSGTSPRASTERQPYPCNPHHPRHTPLQPATPLHTEQVRAARAAGIRVILAHECDPALGGCEFSSFFQTTPQDLTANGLYARIAIAFHTGQHRAVSLCLLARELGAVRYRLIKWALKSRGRAAVDTANPGTALVFPRNSSGASSRAVPLVEVEAEHLSRASSCLDSPFVDPPGNEGSSLEEEGRSGRLSLAQGQQCRLASGPEPYLTLESVVRGQAAPREVPAGAVGTETWARCDRLREAQQEAECEATQEAAAEAARLAATEQAREEATRGAVQASERASVVSKAREAAVAAAAAAAEAVAAAAAAADALERAMADGGEDGSPITGEIMADPASAEGKTQSPASARGVAQHLPVAFDSTDGEQGEAAAEAQEKAAEEGNLHHASVGATSEALTDRARAALKIQSVVRGKAGQDDYVHTVDAHHPSIQRVRRQQIATLALQAPSWHEQEVGANAEGATRTNFD